MNTNILTSTVEWCHNHLLNHDPEMLDYAQVKRALSQATIKEWKIGSFPRTASSVRALYDIIGSSETQILVREGDELISKFIVNSLIIPIFDTYCEPIAIIGRTPMSDAEMKATGTNKYDNTVYSKTNNLFGIHKAKTTALQCGHLIVVEGNLDVIMAHQNGISNIVGSSSANLSYSQLLLASRYAKNVTVCFDNDEAGQEANARAIKMQKTAEELGVNLTAMKLPEKYKDVDDFLKSGNWTWK